MEISLILKIAGVGILVSVLNSVLKQSGRDELTWIVTMAGLVVVLLWIVPYIADLFNTVTDLLYL
ncbi:MAG: stage III sporulation protein AC [Clostridiales bacterium]|nr:stage III sporulation protein AC [Clostridiales bacterium]